MEIAYLSQSDLAIVTHAVVTSKLNYCNLPHRAVLETASEILGYTECRCYVVGQYIMIIPYSSCA